MTIEELKRALVGVKDECSKHSTPVNGEWCTECPFFSNEYAGCPINTEPMDWDIDDWKEDSNIESHKSNL